MKRISASLTALCVAALAGGTAAAEFKSMPGHEVVLRAGPPGASSYVREEPGIYAKKRTANIVVTYTGFTPQAKSAFQRAVNKWATTLKSTVTIKVQASFENLGATSGILGSAGPLNFLFCAPQNKCPKGAKANFWYPIAIANKLTKSDNDTANSDIRARFNSQFTNWHFGTGPAPNGKFDFESVVLHELCHGLGFSGVAGISGNKGTLRGLTSNPKLPSIFASFVVDQQNVKLITKSKYPDPSTKMKAALESGQLFFKIGASKYKLFAPKPFQQGSSFSHLDENTFPKGNPNSLMTPQISPGETIRSPGQITQKIMNAMGWK